MTKSYTSVFKTCLLAGASLLAAALATSAAQARDAETAALPSEASPDADQAVDQIMITARRREEKLQDAPITVSAVSGLVLKAERLDRVADYAAKIANFAALQQNTRVSTLTVRGLGGNANSDGSEAGVGLIVDGVFFTHPGFSWLDFVDLDHIELARGPQGTLLGKNTTLGALIVKTKAPSYKPDAALSATASSRNHYQFRANLSGPIVTDKIAGRLTLYGDTGGGWVTNKADGADYLDNRRWAIRGQLQFDPNPSFTDRLIVEHYESREYNNYYPPVGDPSTYVNGSIRNGWARRLLTAFGYAASYDVKDADMDTQGRQISKTDGVANLAELKLGANTLSSISAWRRLYYRPVNDSDYTPYPIFRAGYDVDVDQFSQELRLASPSGETVEWQTGVYLLHQQVRSNYRVQLLSKATAFFLSPALPSAILEGVEGDQVGTADTTSAAVFGQATWRLTERAAITGGLRYTHETRDAANNVFSFGGATLNGALSVYRAAVAGPAYTLQDRKKDDSFSWLINPSYRIGEQVLAYASASYGEKSGAANLGARPGESLIIGPEKSIDYELGVKATMAGGRAVLNANVYNNTIDGYQATFSDPASASGRSYLGNVGKVRLRGVELEGAAQVSEHLNLSFSTAWGEAVYVSYRNAPPPAEYTFAGAPVSVDLSGKSAPFAPNWTGNLSARWEKPLASGLALFAYANEAWRSRVYLNPLSSYGRQEGYALTNAGIGLRGRDERWSVTIWSKNLFDKRYAVAFSAATTISPYTAILGDPRTVGVTLTTKPF